MATIAAIAGIASAAVGIYSSVQQMQKADDIEDARKKANAKARRIEKAKNIRDRQMALRAQQINRASVMAQAVGGGGSAMSSPIQGAMIGNASTFNANIGFSNTINELNRQRLSAIGEAQSIQAGLQQTQNIAQGLGYLSSGLSSASRLNSAYNTSTQLDAVG